MGHKEWEPDEFLDEFLDFDYKKPVPGKDGKHLRRHLNILYGGA